jgi:hypothetical protein
MVVRATNPRLAFVTLVTGLSLAVSAWQSGEARELRKPIPPNLPAPPPDFPPPLVALPGEFAIGTIRGTYVGANGGVDTLATGIARFQRFRLWWAGPPDPKYHFIQTTLGDLLTANGGGGRTTDVLRTDATQPRDWEKFKFGGLYRDNGLQTIQTVKGYYLTAVGGGGKAANFAFHTDAVNVNVRSTWELFLVQKCGDLGTNYSYVIFPHITPGGQVGGGWVGRLVSAAKRGGLVKNALVPGGPREGEFTFIRQGDGSYALRTANGINYVTAIQGGGLAHGTSDWDTLVTDRTQVQAWERFKVVDVGNCIYTIQTVSGYYVGVDAGGRNISTRISDPDAAWQVGYRAKFFLFMYGLSGRPVEGTGRPPVPPP